MLHTRYTYIYDTRIRDMLQTLHTEPRIHKKARSRKIPRVTDEGWNSQKQLSGPVEQKKKEKKRLQDLYLHPKLSPGLVPYRLFKE